MVFGRKKSDNKDAKPTSTLADVIQWTDYSGKEKDVVWKHPSNQIRWGTALIVQQYEAAVFFRDGKIYDVFGPGRHALTTPNMPVLTKAFNTLYQQPLFHSTVYFVAIKEFDGLFGGRTQTRELFPLLANGQYWYKVSDSTLFVNEVVGGNLNISPEEISKFLKGFISENLMKELAAYSLETVFTEGLETISLKLRNAIYDKFKRFGLDLFDLRFNAIDTEDQYRELAVMTKQGVSASEVLRMFTMRESAKELGKSTGGAGMGGAFVIPPLIMDQNRQPQQSQQQIQKQDDEALKILRNRFANGEIDENEYLKKKQILEK
ncbi:MAG: SPFH domain-containing protein [Candidatus Nitrosotenuis sp.]|nr:MAG: SPFH domain-containing protein [Candidatus Nitrosotenuis sp.]